MLPFMAEYLQDILCTILERFIKKSVMDKATSMSKLAKVDGKEKENLLPAKNVDISFATRKIISNVQAKQKVSDRQVFDYLVFLQSLATKLLERNPLQYPVVRYLVCLDPRFTVRNPDQVIRKMTKLLKKVITLKQRSADDYDTILRQYKTFLGEDERHSRREFSAFTQKKVLMLSYFHT